MDEDEPLGKELESEKDLVKEINREITQTERSLKYIGKVDNGEGGAKVPIEHVLRNFSKNAPSFFPVSRAATSSSQNKKLTALPKIAQDQMRGMIKLRVIRNLLLKPNQQRKIQGKLQSLKELRNKAKKVISDLGKKNKVLLQFKDRNIQYKEDALENRSLMQEELETKALLAEQQENVKHGLEEEFWEQELLEEAEIADFWQDEIFEAKEEGEHQQELKEQERLAEDKLNELREKGNIEKNQENKPIEPKEIEKEKEKEQFKERVGKVGEEFYELVQSGLDVDVPSEGPRDTMTSAYTTQTAQQDATQDAAKVNAPKAPPEPPLAPKEEPKIKAIDWPPKPSPDKFKP